MCFLTKNTVCQYRGEGRPKNGVCQYNGTIKKGEMKKTMSKILTLEFEDQEWTLIAEASDGGSVKEWMIGLATALLSNEQEVML
jgi:hypothetical protein